MVYTVGYDASHGDICLILRTMQQELNAQTTTFELHKCKIAYNGQNRPYGHHTEIARIRMTHPFPVCRRKT